MKLLDLDLAKVLKFIFLNEVMVICNPDLRTIIKIDCDSDALFCEDCYEDNDVSLETLRCESSHNGEYAEVVC